MSSSSSSSEATGGFDAAKHDLTATLGQFLDRHMMLPLLSFLESRNIYPVEEINKARLAVFKDTAMLGAYKDLWTELYQNDEGHQEADEKLLELKSKLKDSKDAAKPLLKVVDDQELMLQFESDKTFSAEFLAENYEITSDHIQAMYDVAKLQYEAGNYGKAAPYLHNFTHLSKDSDAVLNALWGKFACEIMTNNWDEAQGDLQRLREAIDGRSSWTPLEQLQQRTWLIHWALFVFFNHSTGRNGIIDMFLDDKYMNAIQTQAPHVLRYLTAAVITNKRGHAVLNDLVRVIEVEAYTYQDPILEFVQSLYVKFDFDGAQKQLDICLQVLTNDFFLTHIREDFLHNARLFIFETYCRIHKTIDIAMLADKLAMDEKAAEKWIVGLIKNAHFGAQHQPKIDSKKNHVVMSAQYPSVHNEVMVKTKELMLRTSILTASLREAKEAQKESKQGTSEGGSSSAMAGSSM